LPTKVTKVDGSKQAFSRQKVVKTCMRMGASRELADQVAEAVQARVYEGIETRKILKMIFMELEKHKPSVRHQVCLRRALSRMRSKPDFETFIQILLKEHGYDVTPNRIIRGRCVEHEVDAVARKGGQTYLVEVKHHYNYHTPTGLDEGRIARSVLEDISEGFEHGLNKLKADHAMIICNTKFSEHAKRYTECRGIHKIGWSSPPKRSLQTMIEEKKLYPTLCLRDLKPEEGGKLASVGVFLLKQLVSENPRALSVKTGIPEKTLALLIERANAVLHDR
jgi:hypothetical protein